MSRWPDYSSGGGGLAVPLVAGGVLSWWPGLNQVSALVVACVLILEVIRVGGGGIAANGAGEMKSFTNSKNKKTQNN